ncbi:MAG TPA: LacI family DNA-binding transcriptional regulator [Ktedonobacterales bacterium]|nr:LacI family DNA-binding transcriptional regulator [Ktedonobacterales bacterium]
MKRNGEGRTTISQIAREAGVSITTVSKVLNHMPGVAQETRQRVEQVIGQRQYVQSHAARQLRKSQTGLIDLAIMRLEGGYDLGIMQGIQDVLENTRHRLVVFATHEDEDLERRWMRRVLEQASDGVLLLLPYERTGLTNVLVEHQIPFVAIGDRNDQPVTFPSIGSTIWQGGYAATEYLIGLGHRRIGIITLPLSRRTARARLAGYREALESAHIPVDPALIIEGSDLLGAGYQETCALLDLPNPPTAIFAGNDAQAAGVYRALYDRQIAIPSMVSVIGFDDVLYASQMPPPLTTIRQPLLEIGRMAATLLLRMIEGESIGITQVELSTSLIVRESCAPPPVR